MDVALPSLRVYVIPVAKRVVVGITRCGLGCGRPAWKDGYCAQCWNRENQKFGGPVAILPRTEYTDPVTAEDLPDYFPKDWT